jgi:hypothetical protein
MRARIAAAAFCLCLALACRKGEEGAVEYQTLASGTSMTLHSLHAIPAAGGRLLACGGDDNGGIVLQSGDQGDTWSPLGTGFDQALYDI